MNNLINNLNKTLFVLVLSLCSFSSYAENAKEFGDFVVHYNAFRSDTISPEIAKQYDLARASNRVIINIAVLEKILNTTGKPTSSEITGSASNLSGQLKQLNFKKITEGTAIYYLAETKISDGEFLKFDIKVMPEGATKASRLHFEKRFYTH